MPKKTDSGGPTSQSLAFLRAAKDLGCDDDEDAFDKKLKAVASAPAPKPVKRKKAKRSAK